MKHIDLLNNLTFGVELETCRPADLDSDDYQRVGPYRRGINQTWLPTHRAAYWKAEHDGSIQPPAGFVRSEYVSPVLKGVAGLRNLLNVVEKLTESGHRVNQSCGVHVHIGLRSVTQSATADHVVNFITKLQQMFHHWDYAMYGQTGTRRERSGWAHRLNASELDTVRFTQAKSKAEKDQATIADLSYGLGGKYRAVNVSRVGTGTSNAATIEFRFMAGTLNPLKLMLHLSTIFFLVSKAWTNRNRFSEFGWSKDRPYQNTRRPATSTLRWVLKRMKAGSDSFLSALFDWATPISDNWDAIVDKGIEMTKKYDSRIG